MEFVDLTPALAPEWDLVVYHSDDGWAFSLAGWLDMVTPIWQMENRSFAIRENGRLVAVIPLHWVPAAKRLASSGWGHGGPAILAEISAVDRRRLWRAALSHVKEIAIQLGARSINIMISPLCQSSLTNRWGVNPMVEFGFTDASTHARIVNLCQEESELWFGLAQDARQQIKRSRAAGYTVRRCSWKELVDEYYRVHVENYCRTGVQPHPKAYFEGIANLPAGRHVLWVGFAPNGMPVAFHNDARFGTTALYHTGCSETAHLKSGINYWLFWEALLGAKTDGCAFYETGEVFPQANGGKEKGLTDFKGKFGGELHRLFRGEAIPEFTPPEATNAIFSKEGVYKTDTISKLPSGGSRSYMDELLQLRLDMVRQYARDANILDVCCATGLHLLSFRDVIKHGVGLDFSGPYIQRANENRNASGARNVEFVCDDACVIPFDYDSFDVVYSFSALYTIPDVHKVIGEIGRVLKPGGICILDLGNRFSLNAIVGRAYLEESWAPMFLLSLPAMRSMFRKQKLSIREHRAFQILPLWGADRPAWLKPLLWKGWTRLLARFYRGKMLDEWISNLPGLKLLAFRHVFVCEKR
jgi:SAM-dependent methyltransferase